MKIWCGEVEAAQQLAKLEVNPPVEMTKLAMSCASSFESPGYGLTPLAEMVGGDIAMVRVAGNLINGSAGWRRLYNYIGYEDIKGALVEAVGRQDVKGIAIYFDTPGGAVNGVQSTANLIAEINKLKPIVGFAATAASAGYWLASGCESLVAQDTSILGSIGTIAMYANYVGMNEKEGIKYHIFKSGSLKMAGNPLEEMTDEVKAHLQMQVEDLTTLFYRDIAIGRKQDASVMRENFGDGRSVLGMRALAGGLIDEIGTLGTAIERLRAKVKAKDTSANLGIV